MSINLDMHILKIMFDMNIKPPIKTKEKRT